jgi:hypothetical protein
MNYLILFSIILITYLHHVSVDLVYLFPIEMIIIFPLVMYYINNMLTEYLNSSVLSFVINIFIILAIINIFSSFVGSHYLQTNLTRNISFSITYILMLIYFVYGKVISTKINSDMIESLSFYLLLVTFIIVVLELNSVVIRIILIEIYGTTYDLEYYDNFLLNLDWQGYRVIGPFRNPNNLSVITIVILSICHNKYKVARNVVSTSFAFFIIIYSGSRTGILLLVLHIGYYYFFINDKNIFRKINSIGLVILIVVLFSYLYDSEFQTVLNRFDTNRLGGSFDTRIEHYWFNSLERFLKFPIIGSGFMSGDSFTSDNLYLTVASANGFVGLLLFISPFIVLLYNNITYRKNETLTFLLIVFFASSFTGDFYLSRPLMPLLFVFVGYYYSSGSLSNSKFKRTTRVTSPHKIELL